MLHLVQGLYTEWTRKVPFNILVLGAESVGKSCLVEAIKSTCTKQPGLPPERVRPTVGQNLVELPIKADFLRFWDLGGSDDMQRIWPRYFDECNALLWVNDARWWCSDETQDDSTPNLDEQRRQQAAKSWALLQEILAHDRMSRLPLLIVLNQTDRLPASEGASTEELEEDARLWWGSRLAGAPVKIDRRGSTMADAIAAVAPPPPAAVAHASQDAPPTSPPLPDVVSPLASPALERDGESAPERIWDVVCTSALDKSGVADMVQWLTDAAQDRRERLRRHAAPQPAT